MKTTVEENARSFGGISTHEARSRLETLLFTTIDSARNVVIQAPTSLGKSYTVSTTDWSNHSELTGDQPVVHVSQTTNARDEAIEKSKQAGLQPAVLKGRTDMCPVAGGDYDDRLDEIHGMSVSDYFDYRCDHQHLPFHRVHQQVETELGSLPCSQNSACPGLEQWKTAFPNDQPAADLIHVTANFTHIPSVVEDANVIFDERPEFNINIRQDHVRRAVNRRLKPEGYRWGTLTEALQRQDEELLAEIRGILEGLPPYAPDLTNEYEDALALDIARAVARAEPAKDDLFVGCYERLRVFVDGESTVENTYQVPDLSKARCVIGLDAHPSIKRWCFDTGLDLKEIAVMDRQEARQWRQTERNLTVVQVGQATRSLTGGWRNEGEGPKARAIIRKVYEKHGDAFRTCICPKAIADEVGMMMTDVGVDSPEVMYYGNLKSQNTFKDESVGLVLGCIDPGDEAIVGMANVLGHDATPEKVQTDEGEWKRALNRTFVGEDAAAATELLESVRRSGVAQAIGRYARTPEDPNSSATVYVWTDAVPKRMIDGTARGVFGRITDNHREIESILQQSNRALTRQEIQDQAGVSKATAYRNLKRLADQDLITVSKGTGPNGANEYRHQSGTLTLTAEIDPSPA